MWACLLALASGGAHATVETACRIDNGSTEALGVACMRKRSLQGNGKQKLPATAWKPQHRNLVRRLGLQAASVARCERSSYQTRSFT